MTVEFEVSSASAFDKWCTTLNESYNKDNIVRIVNSLPFWGEDDEVWVGRSSLTREYRLVAKKFSAATKGEWVMILARMFTTETTRRLLWDYLPPGLHRLMEYLSSRVFITSQGIRRLLEVDDENLPHLYWLSVLGGYTSKSFYYMPVSVINSFPALAPKPVSDFLVEQMEEEGLLCASMEGEMMRLISMLQNFYDSGTIERGKAKLAAADINKVVKTLAPCEFYPSASDRTIRSWRSTLLANAYFKMRDSQPRLKVVAPLEALKQIYQGISVSASTQCGYLTKLMFGKLNSSLTWGMCLSHLFKTVINILTSKASEGSLWLLTEGLMAEIDR
ncbi:MAG: hypothetical protein K2K72_03170, partial [Duncaniella sp.]|nr:hypothetical protein [Duncaniella sp.]